MTFSFVTPKLILTGRGCLDDMLLNLSGHGHMALIVCGKSAVKSGTVSRVTRMLDGLKIGHLVFDGVTGEPDDVMVKTGVQQFEDNGCDMLIAIGGGSQIDAMKAIALLSVSGGTIADHAKGAKLTDESINRMPFMAAVPTTSGTGSEVTKFTIITDTESGAKLLIKDDQLIPDLAVVDPELTRTMPEKIAVSSGLDALTHAIESYTSRKAQPLSDTLALSAIKRIFDNISRVIDNPDDMDAREQMSLAALEAGISFNNSSITLVHGMSRPIGAHFHVPHGMSNAILLPSCLEFAIKGQEKRFAVLGRLIGAAMSVNSDKTAASRFIESVKLLCMRLGVPSLEHYGVDKGEFIGMIDTMTEEALASGSPSNTLRDVTADDIRTIYRNLWPEQIRM